MSTRFEELAVAPKAELERLLAQGRAPDLDSLIGYEFRGVNLGRLPALLRIQKFIKGFFRGPASVEGYNIRVRQDGLTAPWLAIPSPEAPRRFGFFIVTPAGTHSPSPGNRHPGSALLDYGSSRRNPRLRIERLLRDYVVAPDHERPDILLGEAYLVFGRLRLPAGFFIIERLQATDWQP